jgi:hypothetical protein
MHRHLQQILEISLPGADRFPFTAARFRTPGRLAQLGERQLDKLEVTGSSPVTPINPSGAEGQVRSVKLEWARWLAKIMIPLGIVLGAFALMRGHWITLVAMALLVFSQVLNLRTINRRRKEAGGSV